VAPALALGNRVVAVPSEAHPLSATDLYQVLDTSDLPGGALNIVTGSGDELARTLASHSDVDAVWRHDGSAEGCAEVERLSAETLKRTWVGGGKGRDWFDTKQAGGRACWAREPGQERLDSVRRLNVNLLRVGLTGDARCHSRASGIHPLATVSRGHTFVPSLSMGGLSRE
jgi:hypothetical protein